MSVPSPREYGFPYMCFGVPPPSPDVRVAFVPVGDRQIMQLSRLMRGKLAEGPGPVPPELAKKMGRHDVPVAPTVYPQIDITGYPLLHAAIDRFGQTALMVHWIHRMTIEVATGRRNGPLQAISLYLTGLDSDADNATIADAHDLRLGPQRRPLPLSPQAWEKIKAESRPMAVQIFLQPLAHLDQSVRAAFMALGIAFFGTLGVESHRGDEPET